MICRVVNTCWYIFKWTLVVVLLGVLVAVPYLYYRVDEEIRSRIEAKIAEQYPHLKVKVRFARLVEGQGIEVRGLSIFEPGAEGPRAELAYLDELFLSCQTDLQQLVQGQPHVTEVKIRRPILRATRRSDGSWSIAKLLPLPRFSDSTPEGSIENATLEIFDPLKNPATTMTLRDIQLGFKPSGPRDQGGRKPLDVTGSLSADHMQRVEFSGTVDPDANRWSLGGKVDALEISPELRSALPADLAARLNALGTLRAESDLTFQVSHTPGAQPPMAFDISGQLVHGRVDDERLPYPLTDLAAKFHATNAGFVVSELTARNGQTTLSFSCRRDGYEPTSPLVLEGSGTRVRLDQQLLAVLPDELREQMQIEWNNFLPEGDVNADVRLTFDGQNWTPEVVISCLNVSFTCHKFPYRLQQGAGVLALRNHTLTINLTAYSASQPVRIEGEIKNPGHNFTGWFKTQGDNLPFDEKLFAALHGKTAEVVRSLNPGGSFNVYSLCSRDDPRQAEMHQHAVIALNRCSLSYDKFPYPLSNIRGTLELKDGRWTFMELAGTNDTGLVTCKGYLICGDEGELLLNFTAENAPLEEELRDALPPGMQHLWNALQPRGSFDLRESEVRYSGRDKQLHVKLKVEPRGETTSIEPTCFPYRFERLRGTIDYRDGRATFNKMEAAHAHTTMSSTGACEFQPDGGWHLQLSNLTVDKLISDRDAIAAMPEALRRAIGELKPSGLVNLRRGKIDFSRGPGREAPLKSQWDVHLDMQQAGLDCGVKLENIFGTVRLMGGHDGARLTSRGEVDLNSLTYKNFQFKDVQGPMWVENNRVLFGAWAETPKPGRVPRRMTAKVFDGVLAGDCQVLLGSPAKYTLAATVAGAKLAQIARENFPGRQKLNGSVLANLELTGNSQGPHTWNGRGNVHLADADIYELPVMVSLLKILSVRPPDATAFTTSDIEFRVQGEQFLFDKINFNGDAVSLHGLGSMKLDRQIDLSFHAMVGRGDFQVPVLHNLIGEASNQILQIRVTGTVDSPETSRQAFPVVNQAIQELQAGMKGRDPKPASPPQAWLRGLVPRR